MIKEGPPDVVTALHLERTAAEAARRAEAARAAGLDPVLRAR